MEKVDIQEFIVVTDARVLGGDARGAIGGVSCDSRTLKKGDLFFALKGPHYDGHQFIDEALGKGGCGAVIDKRVDGEDGRTIKGRIQKPLFLVDSVLEALHRFAQYYRKKFKIRVVGITGSCGKTIVKEMIASILKTRYCVVSTKGNYNNLIGLPLTIFNIRKDTHIAVLEMGANHLGEIGKLAEISQPQVAVITNIGYAHLEFFGCLENVLSAKMELVKSLPEDGVAILNNDDSCLRNIINGGIGKEIISFGSRTDSDVKGNKITQSKRGLTFSLEIGNKRIPVKLRGWGKHLVSNALAACSVGYFFKIRLRQMAEALANSRLPPSRLQMKRFRKGYIIDDSYNANPDSARAALELLSEIFPQERKVFVLGDMLELGENGEKFHRQIGELIGRKKNTVLFTIGEKAYFISEGAEASGIGSRSIYTFLNKKKALARLKKVLLPGDVILVKGSHALHMEDVVNEIMEWN